MILHKLNLANFRAFEQIEIEFVRDLNVIAGVNGVGKTAILDAIAVMSPGVCRTRLIRGSAWKRLRRLLRSMAVLRSSIRTRAANTPGASSPAC